MLEEEVFLFAVYLFLLVVVLELVHDLLLLVVCKDLDFPGSCFAQSHPRIAKYLLRSHSLDWVSLQNPLKHRQSLVTDVTWLAPCTVDLLYLLLKLLHIGGLKRHSPVQHGVEDDSSGPDVTLESFIASTLEHLRGNVSWSSALFSLHGLRRLDYLGDSEVADFDVSFGSQQNVVQLDVSVQHPLRVDVSQARDYLPEDELGRIFLEFPPSPDVGEQVAATTDLHHVDNVGVSLEALVQPDDVFVASPFENVVLLHHLFEAVLVLHESLVDGLKRHKLASEPVDSQVHLAKSSLSNDFAYLVVVDLRYVETTGNVLQNLVVNSPPRSQDLAFELGGGLFELSRVLSLVQFRLHQSILGNDLLLVLLLRHLFLLHCHIVSVLWTQGFSVDARLFQHLSRHHQLLRSLGDLRMLKRSHLGLLINGSHLPNGIRTIDTRLAFPVIALSHLLLRNT